MTLRNKVLDWAEALESRGLAPWLVNDLYRLADALLAFSEAGEDDAVQKQDSSSRGRTR